MIYLDTERSEEAEQVLQMALCLRQELVEAYPKRSDYQRQLASTYDTLGELYYRAKSPSKARQVYEEELRRLEVLVREHPFRTDYKTILGACQVNLGNLDRDLGRPWVREKTTLIGFLMQRIDRQSILHRGLEVISERTLASSLDWYGKAIKTLEAVVAREANHARAQRFLANAYSGQARVLNHLNRHDEALDGLNRAIQLSSEKQGHQMDAKMRVRFAELYSLAYASARDIDPGQGEHYAVQAVELLRQAIAQGYKEAAVLKTDRDFNVLRQRPDFQKLLVELEQSQQGGHGQ
jgi:tetratricopeptide (TPR) repeat protein